MRSASTQDKQKSLTKSIAADQAQKEPGLSILKSQISPRDRPRTTPSSSQSKQVPLNKDLRATEKSEQIESNKKIRVENFSEKSGISEKELRLERLIKDLKCCIVELESENKKLKKEIEGLKQINRLEVDSIQDRDTKLIADYQKKVKELEEQSRFYTHENSKLKKDFEKELKGLKQLLKEADWKIEAFRADFPGSHCKIKQDMDEISFKDALIKKIQEGLKDKTKAIYDLRQANEQYIKYLQEKEARILSLEKDLKKEKESSKYYSGKPCEFTTEKIEKKRPEKDSLRGSASQKPLYLRPQTSSEFNLKSVEKKKSELDTKFSDLQIENNSLLLAVKDLKEKLRSADEVNKTLKNDLQKKLKKEVITRNNEKNQDLADLNTKLTEVLKSNEMTTRTNLELNSECEALKQKLLDYQENLNSNQGKNEKNLEDLIKQLKNIQETAEVGFRLLKISPGFCENSLTEDLAAAWTRVKQLLEKNSELQESAKKVAAENQFLTDENKEMFLQVEKIEELQSENKKKTEEVRKTKNEIKEVVRKLKIFIGLSYENREVFKVPEDLEGILIEIQKIIENSLEASSCLEKLAKENKKIKEKIKDLQETKEFYENAAEEISALQDKNKELEEQLAELSIKQELKKRSEALKEAKKTEELNLKIESLLNEKKNFLGIEEKFQNLLNKNERLKEKLKNHRKNSEILEDLNEKIRALQEENSDLQSWGEKIAEKLEIKKNQYKELREVLRQETEKTERLIEQGVGQEAIEIHISYSSKEEKNLISLIENFESEVEPKPGDSGRAEEVNIEISFVPDISLIIENQSLLAKLNQVIESNQESTRPPSRITEVLDLNIFYQTSEALEEIKITKAKLFRKKMKIRELKLEKNSEDSLKEYQIEIERLKKTIDIQEKMIQELRLNLNDCSSKSSVSDDD